VETIAVSYLETRVTHVLSFPFASKPRAIRLHERRHLTYVCRSIEFDMRPNTAPAHELFRTRRGAAGGLYGGGRPPVRMDGWRWGRDWARERHGAAPPAGSVRATAELGSRWNLSQRRDTLAHHIGVINAARPVWQPRHCMHSSRTDRFISTFDPIRDATRLHDFPVSLCHGNFYWCH